MISYYKMKRSSFQSVWIGGFIILLVSVAGWAVANESEHIQVSRGDHDDQEVLRFRRIRVERQPVIIDDTDPQLVRSGELLLLAGAGGQTAVSRDGGITWQESEPIPVEDGSVDALAVRDGAIVAAVATSEGTTLFVSRNGDRWKATSGLSPLSKNRPIQLSSGELMAAVKLPSETNEDDGDSRTALVESTDKGKTWSDPRPVTRPGQVPGNLVELPDGRLVLSYVELTDPYGARAIISEDGGQTWGNQVFVLGTSRYCPAIKPRPTFCEPGTGVSTIVLPDGTLVSALDRGQTRRHSDAIGDQPAIDVVRWTPSGLEKPPLAYPTLRTTKVDKKGYLDNGMIRIRPDDRFYGGDYAEEHEMNVFRRLPAEQLEFPTIGTHGVVVCRHPDGSLLFTCRDPVIYRSTDEGCSWQKLADIERVEGIGRWASWGFGVSSRGTLLYSYGELLPVGQGYIARSDDNGKTWSQVPLDPAPMEKMGHGDSSRIVELSDGTLLTSCGNAFCGDGLSHWATHRGYAGDIILRSTDDGKSWGDGTVLPPGACESNFVEMSSGKLLIATRYQRDATVYDLFTITGPQPLPLDPDSSRDRPVMPDEEEYASHPWWGQPGIEVGRGRYKNEAVMISHDQGRTFGTPELVTRMSMVSADVVRMPDNRVVMVYQHKDPPCGVRGLVSCDEGNTWETERYILGYGVKRAGRASSVVLNDGRVYTMNSLGGKVGIRATIWTPE